MKPHKWAKEIKAWADGAEIEYFDDDINEWRNCTSHTLWYEDDTYRIKPQPKEPQYLYVYYGKLETGNKGYFFEKQRIPYIESGYIGKIKLEQDDE